MVPNRISNQVEKKYCGTVPDKSSALHPLHGKVCPDTFPIGTEDLQQAIAKRYLPPGTSIWQGNKVGTWNSHTTPHQRISEPWAKHGGNSRMACESVIKRAWELWLFDQGLPFDHALVAIQPES